MSIGSRVLAPAATFALAMLLSGSRVTAAAQRPDNEPKPDITLEGAVSGSQNHTYIEVPFHVPAGVHRVTIAFSYTEREQKTALDLGLEDPVEMRCWSGGNKSVLTVGISDATPSCLTGPIPAGDWHVLIGVPNIRTAVTSHYTAKVYLSRSGLVIDEPAVLRVPLRSGPAWYRGDLHMHTGHSDGHCASQTGTIVPCPVFATVDAAVKRGLDFIAITDHNATSQYESMRELQPYFDNMLLIPGREITTFQGHMNIFGTTDFLDFRLGSKYVPNVNVLLDNAARLGALASINHPNAPGGEICMGCRWTPEVSVQMKRFTSVEVVNGGGADDYDIGLSFWEEQLNQGYRLTAIGGSDNHEPTLPPDAANAVGHPTTVVYANELSTLGILAGIRSGRVFVDVEGTRNRMLDLSARAGSSSAVMGEDLHAAAGQKIDVDAEIIGADGGSVQLIGSSGEPSAVAPQTIRGDRAQVHWAATAQAGRGWFFVEVHDASGEIILVSNPIYVNWSHATA